MFLLLTISQGFCSVYQIKFKTLWDRLMQHKGISYLFYNKTRRVNDNLLSA